MNRQAILGLVLWLGLAASSVADPARPAWLEQAKSDDSLFMYKVGVARGQPSAEQALQAAADNARAAILADLVAAVAPGRLDVFRHLPLKQAAVMPNGTYAETRGTRHDGWVLLGWPLAEKERLQAEIERVMQWIDLPAGGDDQFFYRVGTARGQATAEAAQAVALALATDGFRRQIQDAIKGAGAPNAWLDQVAPAAVDIVPGRVHLAPAGAAWSAWVQARCPRTEQDRWLERAAAARQARAAWQAAEAAMAAGDLAAAQGHLEAVLSAPGAGDAVDLDATRLKLAGVYEARRVIGGARKMYTLAGSSSTNPALRAAASDRLAALPPPARLEPLAARMEWRPMAILAVTREKGRPAAMFPELTGLLRQEAQAAQWETSDPATNTGPDSVAAAFDTQDWRGVTAAAGQALLLAVLCEIDSSKSGQTQNVMGMDLPVKDAAVLFAVVSAAGPRVVYAGRFSELAGQAPRERLAERVAAILIKNYLAPYCPAAAP